MSCYQSDKKKALLFSKMQHLLVKHTMYCRATKVIKLLTALQAVPPPHIQTEAGKPGPAGNP